MNEIDFITSSEQAINLGVTGNQIYQTSPGSIFMQLFGLLVILFLVFFLLIFIKKKSENIFNKSNNMSEIERFYFFPKTFISILKIGEEYFIVSVSETDIKILEKIDEKNLIDKLKLESTQKNKNGKNFSDYINIGNSNFENIKKRLKNMRQNEDE